MRFTFEGRVYEITFKRHHSNVFVPDTWSKHVKRVRKSQFPYTTVKILVVDESSPAKDWGVFRTGTVGCWFRDKFNHENGRLNALKFMTKGNSMSKDMKSAVWDAYMSRPRGVPEPKEPVVQAVNDLKDTAKAIATMEDEGLNHEVTGS